MAKAPPMRAIVRLLALTFVSLLAWAQPGWAVTVDSSPSAVSPNAGAFDVFVRGSDGALWHRWYANGQWQPWGNLGGCIVGDPQAISPGPDRINVYVRGCDDRLYQKWYANGTWSGTFDLIGDWEIKSNPVPVSWGSDHIDVFARGNDNALIHTWWSASAGWQPWSSLGGSISGDPAPVSTGTEKLNVYAHGTDGHLVQRWYANGTWAPWETLGDWAMTGRPKVIMARPGYFDVFGRGNDATLIHNWFAPGYGWQGWSTLGGAIASDPTGVSWGNGHEDVFSTDGAGYVVHRWYFDGSGWNPGWQRIGDWQIDGRPEAISRGSGDTYVFGRGKDGALVQVAYGDGRWDRWRTLGTPGDNVLDTAPARENIGIASDVTVNTAPGGYNLFDRPDYTDLGAATRRHRVTAVYDGSNIAQVQSIVDMAYAHGAEVMVTLRVPGGQRPSAATYAAGVQNLVNILGPKVRYWGVLNEPSMVWGNGQIAGDAQLLAQYYQQLVGIVGAGNVVGPDFLDDSDGNYLGLWVAAYRSAGGGFGAAAAMHPYGAITAKSAVTVDTYLSALPSGTHLWFTEAGSRLRQSSGEVITGPTLAAREATQADQVHYLLYTLLGRSDGTRVADRVYYYSLQDPSPTATWDSHLVRQEGGRRPSWTEVCVYAGGHCS